MTFTILLSSRAGRIRGDVQGSFMTQLDQIIEALGKTDRICDDCLAIAADISPRQAVNLNCRKFERSGGLVRSRGQCSTCSSTKILNVLRDANVRQTSQRSYSKRIVSEKNQAKKIEAPYIRGNARGNLVHEAINSLAQKIRNTEIEIYNEFSLQHELGIILRDLAEGLLVQFERNVSYFGFGSQTFEKREIDIVVFSRETKELEYAIELKFPRRGQYPEQMFSFCKDLVFVEQLKLAGFAKTYVLIIAEDPLFYANGSTEGIYGYFRGSRTLTGEITKPTGSKDHSLFVSGEYDIQWQDIQDSMKYTLIDSQIMHHGDRNDS